MVLWVSDNVMTFEEGDPGVRGAGLRRGDGIGDSKRCFDCQAVESCHCSVLFDAPQIKKATLSTLHSYHGISSISFSTTIIADWLFATALVLLSSCAMMSSSQVS